jgi:zinc transport system permease protein
MAFTLTGLWVSYQFNLASGATIIMVAGVGFFLSLGIGAVAAPRN